MAVNVTSMVDVGEGTARLAGSRAAVAVAVAAPAAMVAMSGLCAAEIAPSFTCPQAVTKNMTTTAPIVLSPADRPTIPSSQTHTLYHSESDRRGL
ncbi:MAG: hypothetical protein M5U01_33545 [Ardenticatenaceae bacterium]|nr:hypothetical protein [Ardenticatenaceae bacterium]